MKRYLKTILTALFLVSFGLSTTGCSFFKKLSRGKKRRTRKTRKQRKAERAKAKAIALKEFPAWVASKSCDNASEVFFKKFYKHTGRDERTQAAVKFARCGDWKTVFQRLFASNRGWALHMLKTLENTNLSTPVHKGLEKWIAESEQPFKFKLGYYVADFLRYAVDRSSKKSNYCKAYFMSAKKAPQIRNRMIRSKVRRYGLGFLMVGKCTQYKSFVTEQLTSDWWIDRKIACEVLGKWGSKSALRKVSILASSDSFVHRKLSRRYRRPFYPVRKACRSAAGQIRLKN